MAVIGESFVAALEVPIADKLQVRLEALAAAALPELDVTVSAYGRRGTGQVNQLPLYDEYARRLSPNLVVLVFDPNDFENNSAVLSALRQGHDPRRMPYAYPERTADGGFRLRPADLRVRLQQDAHTRHEACGKGRLDEGRRQPQPRPRSRSPRGRRGSAPRSSPRRAGCERI